MLQAMLGYLYANWAHSGLLVAFYATVILLCNVSTIPFFIFLVWMQFPVYLMHEFEEHVYPGNFQFFFNRDVFKSSNPVVPLNSERIFWINILAVWVLLPGAAVLAQLVNPAFGILPPVFGLFNATSHILISMRFKTYKPGLLASVFLNYPTGLYTLYYASQHGILSIENLLIAFLVSLIVHAVIIVKAFQWNKNK